MAMVAHGVAKAAGPQEEEEEVQEDSKLTNLVVNSESSLALSRALATKKTMASSSVQRQAKGTSSSMVT